MPPQQKVQAALPSMVYIGGRLLHPLTYKMSINRFLPNQCKVEVMDHPCVHPETRAMLLASVVENAAPDPQFWCRAFHTMVDGGRLPVFVELSVTGVSWRALAADEAKAESEVA